MNAVGSEQVSKASLRFYLVMAGFWEEVPGKRAEGQLAC